MKQSNIYIINIYTFDVFWGTLPFLQSQNSGALTDKYSWWTIGKIKNISLLGKVLIWIVKIKTSKFLDFNLPLSLASFKSVCTEKSFGLFTVLIESMESLNS